MTIDINLRDIECMPDEQGVRCWLLQNTLLHGIVHRSLLSIAYQKKARKIELVVTEYQSVCGLPPVYTRDYRKLVLWVEINSPGSGQALVKFH